MQKRFTMYYLLMCVFAVSILQGLAQNNGERFRLREQFNGNFGYTMFGNSLSEGPNSVPGFCSILESSSANLNLPDGVSVHKAYLYYAASGYVIEDVKLNENSANFISATSLPMFGNANLGHFFAKADVTEIIRRLGNIEYTFTGLDILNSSIFDFCWEQSLGGGGICPTVEGTDIAGWAVFVVYESDDLPYNSITLFDGYRVSGRFSLPTLDVNTSDVSNSSFSFLAWEGDYGGSVELLTLNNEILENQLNGLPQNLFNHTNTFTNQQPMWNMDLDYFDTSDLTDGSTEQLDFEFNNSGTCPDRTFIQVAVVEIENRLPNPGIELINSQPGVCGTGDVRLTYRVTNTNTTEILPAGVQVNFYENIQGRPLLATELTTQSLQPNESLEIETTVIVPEIRLTFTQIIGEINKTETGETIIKELNPADNSNMIRVEEIGVPQLILPTAFSPNGDGMNDEFYVLNAVECLDNIAEFQLKIFDRYGNIVFTTTDATATWDGKAENQQWLDGTYLWHIDYRSANNTFFEHQRSGVVTIIF